MCFRPLSVGKKREIACPSCEKMNPLPISIESAMSDIMANEAAKAIMEKHCSVMTNDPRFKKAMGMTLKQIKPMSAGKITIDMINTVAQELDALPKPDKCQFCGAAMDFTTDGKKS